MIYPAEAVIVISFKNFLELLQRCLLLVLKDFVHLIN